MLIVGKNTSKIDEFKKELCKSFSMKDLGHAKQILNMRITHLRDERKIYLFQKKYIERVLERFNMKNVKHVSTPLAGHMKLSKKMCPTTREEKENMTKHGRKLLLKFEVISSRIEEYWNLGVVDVLYVLIRKNKQKEYI
uniref:Reverse transcriptase Ty1/copia-type domain-containing protein n=1 Tax=Solanum lycopersicum TaxID=4081 RepID=A0A3Q7HQ68_SOLLC